MMRAEAFEAVGGFDPTVPAGEEPELCQRLREAGWTVVRLDADMTWHDSAMTGFRQWWQPPVPQRLRRPRHRHPVRRAATGLFAADPQRPGSGRSAGRWP